MLLSRIDLYPIKSLDGVSVTQVRIKGSGALESDRIYAIVDRFNRFYRFAVNTSIPLLRKENISA
jgi:uncharacterized protein